MARFRYGPRRFRIGPIEMPLTIAVLIGLGMAGTLSAWMLDHSPQPASPWVPLVGELIWRGEAWRLLTYVFVENEPMNFLFAVLLLYWFGRNLCEDWGARRFVLVYLGLTVSAG